MRDLTITASAHPRHGDIVLLSVKGSIDTNTAPEFERAFRAVLDGKRFNLVVDLKEADFIGSMGWGIFLSEIKRIRGKRGDLVLASMGPGVEETYQLLEFDSILKAFPSVEEAVARGFGRAAGKKNGSPPSLSKEGSLVKAGKGNGG